MKKMRLQNKLKKLRKHMNILRRKKEPFAGNMSIMQILRFMNKKNVNVLVRKQFQR